MPDSSIAITAGSGTSIDTRTESTNGNHRQVVVVGDPSDNSGLAAVNASLGISVNFTNIAISASIPNPVVVNASVPGAVIVNASIPSLPGISASIPSIVQTALMSVASLPLPAGAATESTLNTIGGYLDGVETLLGTIDTDTGNIATNTSTASSNSTIIAANASLISQKLIDGTLLVNASIPTAIGVNASIPIPITVNASIPNGVAVTNAGLTELAAAINSNQIDVNIATDSVGIGGGTQYTESDTDITITGNAIMFESDISTSTLGVVNASNPLPVSASIDPSGLATSANQDTIITDTGVIAANASLISERLIDGTITVDGSGVTQPISAAALPLPSGAATAANQTTIIGHVDGVETLLGTIDADTGNIATSTSAAAANASLISQQLQTGIVVNASLPNAIIANASIPAVIRVNASIPSAIIANASIPGGVVVTNAGTFAVQVSSTTALTPGTAAANLGKAEDAAHSSGDTGVFSLGVANASLTQLSSAVLDYTPIAVERTGEVMVNKAPRGMKVRGTASTAGSGDTSLIAASGNAGLKTYVTSLQVANTGSTDVLVTLKDGSGGSTIGYTIAPAGGGSNVVYETELVTSANTALFFAANASTSTLYAAAQGYLAP